MTRLASVLAAAAILLGGCVYIPTPGPKPFQEDVVDLIVPGKTTRTDVLAALGNPEFRYLDDRLFAYYNSQLRGVVLSYGVGANFKGYYLLVEFDDSGRVVSADRLTADPSQRNFIENLTHGHDSEDRACSAGGYCLTGPPRSELVTLTGFPLFAPTAQDMAAKRFKPDPSACTLYVATPPTASERARAKTYPDTLVLNNRWIARSIFSLDARAFYRIRTRHGRHTLRLDLMDLTQPTGHPRDFDCAAGVIRYFELRSQVFSLAGPTTLRSLHETEGQRVMRESRLVIDSMAVNP